MKHLGLAYQENDTCAQRANTHNNIGKGDCNAKGGQANQDQIDSEQNISESFIDFHFVFLSQIKLLTLYTTHLTDDSFSQRNFVLLMVESPP